MSGPVTTEDVAPEPDVGHAEACEVELTESHVAQVGDLQVRRALPRRQRRTVGSWCFADHMGPAQVRAGEGIDIGPHPHIGLQTVTWLTDGEILHRDSLGSEQLIRPGQLNLMTAGAGVSHSEEGTAYSGPLQGVQFWVVQPEETRHGPAAFEHQPSLPEVELDNAVATVFIGEMDDEGKDLYYCQAEALEAMGNREEALKVYKRIYSQDINFRDVAAKVDALSA